MSAEIVDFAARRRARDLPAPLPTAGQPEPPIGKRRGDRVRSSHTGEIGTVTCWRVERLWRPGDERFGPSFMLGVLFPSATVVLADEVDPVSVGLAERPVALPADVEA